MYNSSRDTISSTATDSSVAIYGHTFYFHTGTPPGFSNLNNHFKYRTKCMYNDKEKKPPNDFGGLVLARVKKEICFAHSKLQKEKVRSSCEFTVNTIVLLKMKKINLIYDNN